LVAGAERRAIVAETFVVGARVVDATQHLLSLLMAACETAPEDVPANLGEINEAPR
jgi:hypothetical protein